MNTLIALTQNLTKATSTGCLHWVVLILLSHYRLPSRIWFSILYALGHCSTSIKDGRTSTRTGNRFLFRRVYGRRPTCSFSPCTGMNGSILSSHLYSLLFSASLQRPGKGIVNSSVSWGDLLMSRRETKRRKGYRMLSSKMEEEQMQLPHRIFQTGMIEFLILQVPFNLNPTLALKQISRHEPRKWDLGLASSQTVSWPYREVEIGDVICDYLYHELQFLSLCLVTWLTNCKYLSVKLVREDQVKTTHLQLGDHRRGIDASTDSISSSNIVKCEPDYVSPSTSNDDWRN